MLKNVTIYLDRFSNKKKPYSVMLIFSQFFSLLFNIVYCRVTDSEFKVKALKFKGPHYFQTRTATYQSRKKWY